ncbi:protoporphyrinogen oxidase [Microbacteriaceae bacterium VKM Ac-2855]|nr:protoporphyrinogen oxidase [Microbacteriaceae bacterium VKM Ac-2855]
MAAVTGGADYDVAIVGGGVAGLVAAIECLRIGARVLVLEAGPTVGGSVAPLELAGVVLDGGAESFATRGGTVAAYLGSLGLGDEIVAPAASGSWLHLPGGRSVPSPQGGVLGIPSSPLAADVIAAIGFGGAVRAYLDRLLPVLKIGREHSLAALVEKRMGRRVLENLVAPVVSGVYSTRPENIDIDVAQPGLNGAITRLGSLSGAVAELRERAAAAGAVGGGQAGAAVRGIRGGMFRMVEALVAKVGWYGGEIRTESAVLAIDTAEAAADSTLWRLRLTDGVLLARTVILAVPESDARRLLGERVPNADAVESVAEEGVELVALAVDDARLDPAPRGTGVLVAPTATDVTAKALTHASAKWAWLAESLPAGRHILRLSYGRPGETPPLQGLDDDRIRELALRDASRILGVELDASRVVEIARRRWTNVRPAAATGQKTRIAAFRAALETLDGLDATGTWLAGTGLASVVPDAQRAAQRIRHRLVSQGLDIPREEYVGDDYSGPEASGRS